MSLFRIKYLLENYSNFEVYLGINIDFRLDYIGIDVGCD